MNEFETFEGTILRVVPYRDKDLIVTLFGEGIGKRAVFAGGARNSRRRFPGGLEPFRSYRMALRTRRSTSMPILSESTIVQNLPGMGASLERISCASCGLSLVDHITQEGELEEGLYRKLWHFLTQLQALDGEDLEMMLLALRWFELHALVAQGLLPHLTHCFRTYTPLSKIEKPGFSLHNGGLLSMAAAEPRDEAIPIEPALLVGLIRLREAPVLDGLLERAAERRLETGGSTLGLFSREAGHVLRALLQQHIGSAPVKAYNFLDTLTSVSVAAH